MPVRAKFQVQSVKRYAWNPERVEVELFPVYKSQAGVSGNACEENNIFGTATPSGKIEMGIENPVAAQQLELGKCYYVDFTEAPD